ncbi:MAG: helix-turn-helix domain-containing protein [Eggerthellaceae bacterium]|nr:helix-turn-helix domain-containing protein [Eggerthellaceae bacterium]
MKLSLRYVYTKTLKVVPRAQIADEHVGRLTIQWVGIASTRFASHAGFLYFVTDEKEVPSPALDPADTFGCVVPDSLADKCVGIPRIIVPDICDLDRLFDYIVKETERYRNWHDTINNLLLSDASYQSLVDATAEFVPRPQYVADAGWRMISRVDFEMGEISATWHYQMLHDGLYPLNIVDALNRTGDYYRISNLPHAALIDSDVYTIRILAKPIRYRGRLVGYYFMIDTWGDLGYCEVEIAEEFGKLIAPIMSSRGAQQGYIAGFQNSYIVHMLDGMLTSRRDIAQELKRETRWDIESDFRMATVRFSPDEYNNHLLHMRTMGQLSADFDSHAYIYKDTAILLYHIELDDVDKFMSHLHKSSTALKRIIVLSNRFSDFAQMPFYYEQNMHIHDTIEEDDNLEPRVISCDSTFPRLLADHCRNSLPICYEAEVLHSYDKAHHTSYCLTLLGYLQFERNAVSTAKALYLHRNTLRNRLNKIEEIIDVDLEDSNLRFYLMVSLNTLLNTK